MTTHSLPAGAVSRSFVLLRLQQPLCLATCIFGFQLLPFAAQAQVGEARELLNKSHTTGGLVVHVGCGDGKLAASLAGAGKGLLVHGLETNAQKVQQARELFRNSSSAERLSAELWPGDALPHADDLVNLLIIEAGQKVSDSEAMRVLAPGGTILRQEKGSWTSKSKPHTGPEKDWTHYQYDAAGNAVGGDKDCGLPRKFQWSATPLWSAAHEAMASLNAMVSANGRVFYIIDEGPRASIQLPSDWVLIARDGYNGVELWRKPLTQWLTRFWPWKSGPAQMPRKLVAVGDRVYAPLDINGALKEFDAATGVELRTYEGTSAAEEFIEIDGILLVQVDPAPPNMQKLEEEVRERRHFSYDGRDRAILDHERPKTIAAIEAASGKTLWRQDVSRISPLSLAAIQNNVIYHDGSSLVCLDLKSGKQKWRTAKIVEKERRLIFYSEEAATVVLREDVAFYAKDQGMTAVSMSDGKILWQSPWVQDDYRSPVSAIVMNGLVWSMNIASAKAPGTFTGRDPLTGEVKKQFDLPPFQGIGHHRCYKAKATGDFVLLSRSGVEYVNPDQASYDENHWIRGACLYGILPANGMLYSTPHACACYIKGKLNGFTAMTPGSVEAFKPDYASAPQEKGPAYRVLVKNESKPGDWPTYRHDITRSGRSATTVPVDLKETWSVKIGDDLTSPTIGHGLVIVSERSKNTVHALSDTTGKEVWTYTAGGKVDSPPTISDGHVFFGSADGCVYSLRATDGELAWRTRAAPVERRVVGYGRVESAWPVNGSVLVQNGVVYADAGRSSFLDGGIHVVKIDADSGKVLSEQTVYDLKDGKQPPLKGSFDMEGALPDVLSGDGERVFMRHLSFDSSTLKPRDTVAHVFSPAGYLDDTWWHRIYWVYGDDTQGGYGGWWQAGNKLPAGRLMVFDDDHVYSYGRPFYAGVNAAQFGRGEEYVLAASKKEAGKEPDYGPIMKQARSDDYLKTDWASAKTTPMVWSEQIPFNVRAMAMADKTLFAMGAYGDAVRSEDAYTGKKGVRLGAFSPQDGKQVASYAVAALPVWDGLAAANGRLYAAHVDGTVRCYGPKGTALKSTLGESIEVIKEKLLESDEEYRAKVREAVGLPVKATVNAGGGVLLQGKNLASQFTTLSDGKVVAGPLGYRLGANQSKIAVAVSKLPAPVTGVVSWKFQMKPADGYPNPPHYQNGFFAFGDGPEDASLVKCGIQFVRGTFGIIQGPTGNPKGSTGQIEGEKDRTFDVEVVVDLVEQDVTLIVGKDKVRTKLKRPLQSVTHVGFVSWNSVTDFSTLKQATR